MNQHEQIAKSRLGRLLVNRGYITEDQLSEALKLQAEQGVLLGEVLLAKGLISEKDLARTLKQQKRTRYTAALVALVATPFQPMIAFAATPAGLPITNQKIEASEVNFGSLSGLQMLDDSELASIDAQGISPMMLNVSLENFANSVNSGAQHKYRDHEDDEEQHEELIAKELADTALTAAGIGPISNFLDADMTIEGVKYEKDEAPIQILADGSIRFNMPTEIERISMENIRIKGDTNGATMGSIYLSDIQYNPASNYTIRARN